MKKKTKENNSALMQTESGQSLTEKERKKLAKKQKRQESFQKLTRNEIENIYALPDDDLVTAEETKIVTNRHYLTVSNCFRIAAWISVLILAAFLLFMFFSYRDEITVENFRYLLRNVNFRLESSAQEEDGTVDMIYDWDENRVFCSYKDYLATIGYNRLVISDLSGDQAYDSSLEYENPTLCSSDSYLLCYDRFGKEYSLYSYFNNVESGSCDYEICDAVISDSGYYALATRDSSYYGVVLVYNSNFQLAARIRKNKYIVSVDLTTDGSEVLITSFYTAEDGKTYTEITAQSVTDKAEGYNLVLEDVVPLEARYFQDGGSVVLCTDQMIFIDQTGKIYNTVSFSEKNVIKYTIGVDSVSLVSSKANNSGALTISVYQEGELLCSASATGKAALLYGEGEDTYFYNGQTLYRLNHVDGTWTSLEVSSLQQLVLVRDEPILCFYTHLLAAEFSDS
jgi:hypothetical protein